MFPGEPESTHDIMKCIHRLLDRSIVVKSVTLKQIDIIHSESLQGSIYRCKDVLSRQSSKVDVTYIVQSASHTAEGGRADLPLLSGSVKVAG